MEKIFTQAKSFTLRTEVLEMLRDAIITGKLKPGDHLKENQLADQMSVSRSPVREALRQLEQEDLVAAVPNQGCFVKTFTEEEIIDVFRLRASLENLAFELIVEEERFEEEDWENLNGFIANQIRAIDALAFDDLTKYDMEFHEYFCIKSGSKLLLKTWKGLRAQIQMLFYQRFKILEEVPKTVHVDHLRIMEKLKEGDIVGLKQLNRAINARVARECIEVFKSNGEEDF